MSDATVHRMRGVLAIRGFRRLWGVTYLCGIGDWLGLIGLSSLVGKLTHSYQLQAFSLSIVVATQLLPAMLFMPLGGIVADRFDRRKVLVTCDLLRCTLYLSIALVGNVWWLVIANFLVGCASTVWIPAKESAIPNLVRRSDQVETANQLSLVMTYGISMISGASLFSLISGIQPLLNLDGTELGVANVIVVVNGLLFLGGALVVALRIPEISGRSGSRDARAEQSDTDGLGLFAMLRDGVRFVGSTPLVRGLVIGIVGAVAAAGAVIATAQLYANSLSGGDAAYGMLFVAVFVGLATGMAIGPRVARRLPRRRLFGLAIVTAGSALLVNSVAPQLWVALVAAALVGGNAGVAFLTALTIVGNEVDDTIRGRTVAFVQSLVKIVLMAATAGVPLLVALLRPRTITLFGHDMVVDGTRPVLLAAGVIAILSGLLAYRQMNGRRRQPLLSGLVSALRGTKTTNPGLLLAVEGDTIAGTTEQARRLSDWLDQHGYHVVLAGEPDNTSAPDPTNFDSPRAHALVAAAVRADAVERVIRPALEAGSVVVMEQYLDSPLAHFGASGRVDTGELESLADWATGRLRPDITVLLDADPGSGGVATTAAPPWASGVGVEHHWKVQRLLTEMAAADPERYLVVDADGTPDEVEQRVRGSVEPVLTSRKVGTKAGAETDGAITSLANVEST